MLLKMYKVTKRKIFLRPAGRRGFTLIEMITVITIIAIGASIAVPNFANMIQRNQIKSYVQTARNAENALLALTGLQYANSETGNPEFIAWPDKINPAEAPGKQFVSVDKAPSPSLLTGVFQVTVARVSGGDSEGQREFYKRTMNDLRPVAGRDGPVCAAYFTLEGANGPYVHYSGYFKYSEYYMTEGKTLAVFHNVKVQPDGTFDSEAGGWHVYEYRGASNYIHIGSVSV